MRDLDRLAGRRVVALPDLFLDLFVPLPRWSEARARLDAIAAHGGGNLPVDAMQLRLGGNALNLARAVAALGADTTLIAETDLLGRMLLERDPPSTLDLGRVRTGGRATTVALECRDANLMLSHGGPIRRWGPDDLDDGDEETIAAADAVAVVNWAQTRHGTALLERVAALVRPDALLYLDTGDPRHRMEEVPALLDAVARTAVTAWSMNENEALAFGGGRDPVAAARDLAGQVGVRIDLHTRTQAISIGEDEVGVAAPSTPGRRTTGAGDHWNAGNLAGYLLGLDVSKRLRLAHAVATAYVCSEDGAAPSPARLQVA